MLDINKKNFDIEDLLQVMTQLRDPETGCPWDIKQTKRSIVRHTIEEVYELVDAVEAENVEQFKSELGDVLFQVVFLSKIAEREDGFDFKDVVSVLTEKLIHRHPHVFDENYSTAVDVEDVNQLWEVIKEQERSEKGQPGLFDDVPTALPALTRTEKLQKRAAKIGLEFPDTHSTLNALKSEVIELEAAINENSHEACEEELGDVIFSALNVARKLGINAEQALRASNRKFVERVEWVDQYLQSHFDGQVSDILLERLWQDAKKTLSRK